MPDAAVSSASSAVRDPAFQWAMGCAGGDIDNSAPAALDHMRHDRAQDVVGADQVDLDIAAPRRRIALDQRSYRLNNACVVHQDVGVPKAVMGVLEHLIDGSEIGHIAGGPECLATILGD
jgi:hypothetical protein